MMRCPVRSRLNNEIDEFLTQKRAKREALYEQLSRDGRARIREAQEGKIYPTIRLSRFFESIYPSFNEEAQRDLRRVIPELHRLESIIFKSRRLTESAEPGSRIREAVVQYYKVLSMDDRVLSKLREYKLNDLKNLIADYALKPDKAHAMADAIEKAGGKMYNKLRPAARQIDNNGDEAWDQYGLNLSGPKEGGEQQAGNPEGTSPTEGSGNEAPKESAEEEKTTQPGQATQALIKQLQSMIKGGAKLQEKTVSPGGYIDKKDGKFHRNDEPEKAAKKSWKATNAFMKSPSAESLAAAQKEIMSNVGPKTQAKLKPMFDAATKEIQAGGGAAPNPQAVADDALANADVQKQQGAQPATIMAGLKQAWNGAKNFGRKALRNLTNFAGGMTTADGSKIENDEKMLKQYHTAQAGALKQPQVRASSGRYTRTDRLFEDIFDRSC